MLCNISPIIRYLVYRVFMCMASSGDLKDSNLLLDACSRTSGGRESPAKHKSPYQQPAFG